MEQGNFQISGAGVDIVLVIDDTGSMAPVIEKVKTVSKDIYKKLTMRLEERGRPVEELRIKVISFGDFCDGPDAIRESEFFVLPEQADAFEKHVSTITPHGGGDNPENAFEALYKAIVSPWNRNQKKLRHIVVLFTDAPAKALRVDETLPGYPTEAPSNVEELGILWDSEPSPTALTGMKRRAHRLCVFSPRDAETWDQILGWHKVQHVEVKADDGGKEITTEAILAFLVDSATED
jgi:hypothetical protein